MTEDPRIALVTAAAGGIGQATVRHLLASGLLVVAADRDAGALQTLRSACPEAALHTIVGDMTSEADVARAVALAAQLGDLAVLVNGVGSACSSSLRDLTLAEWQRLFALNLTSVFLCVRAALPLLETSSGDRVIINISSTLAQVADPQTLAYGAFKAGLEQLTRALALEVAPKRIRALALAPGPVAATGGEAAFETDAFARLNPLGRFANVDEIGALIAFLASPAAAYISGTTIRVDGGDSALGAGWGPLQALLRAQQRQISSATPGDGSASDTRYSS
jgi:NAD(P)-dependent dehydrogenase (short-subunit alcohol dehydrogenase family)